LITDPCRSETVVGELPPRQKHPKQRNHQRRRVLREGPHRHRTLPLGKRRIVNYTCRSHGTAEDKKRLKDGSRPIVRTVLLHLLRFQSSAWKGSTVLEAFEDTLGPGARASRSTRPVLRRSWKITGRNRSTSRAISRPRLPKKETQVCGTPASRTQRHAKRLVPVALRDNMRG